MYETYDEELQYVFDLSKKENRVWTIVEGDDGMCFVAGFHLVNRMGYLVTEKPWNDEGDWVELDNDMFNDEDEDPTTTVYKALLGYVEDSAGEGSREADAIEDAWQKIIIPFSLNDDEQGHIKTVLDSLEQTSDLYRTLAKVFIAIT